MEIPGTRKAILKDRTVVSLGGLLRLSFSRHPLHLACWNGEQQTLDVFVRDREECYRALPLFSRLVDDLGQEIGAPQG